MLSAIHRRGAVAAIPADAKPAEDPTPVRG
jgi:hypothetical protein